MLRILLIRPGETEFDRQGRILGTLDMPLSEDGRQQVAGCLEGLQGEQPVALYTAPSQSAQQTAAELGEKLDLKPKTIDKLQNLNHGLWQGLLVDDVKTKQPKVYRQWQEQPETICPPEGEPVSAAKERVAEVLKKLIKRHKAADAVALVCPEPLASVVRNVLQQDELSHFWDNSENCGSWEAIPAPEGLIGAS